MLLPVPANTEHRFKYLTVKRTYKSQSLVPIQRQSRHKKHIFILLVDIVSFQASEDDFEIVCRNGNQYFQSRSLVHFWKCKYIHKKWKCVEEGLMMAIFNDEGHFLYHDSIQATEEKENHK